MGLPAKASQAKRGMASNQSGKTVKRLAESRSSSSWVQAASSGGKCASSLPASMSFCSCTHWPISGGSALIWLSVRINQRKFLGKAAAETLRIWLALKPTIVKFGHCPNTSGSSVNGLSEQKMTRSLCSLGKSSGKLDKALPERLRISSESAKSKISRGNSARLQDRSSRWVPAN